MNEAKKKTAAQCRLKLQRNLEPILQNLRVSDVVDHLFSERVINEEEYNEIINSRETERTRMRKLFFIIYNSPDFRMERSFQVFIEAVNQDADWLALQIATHEVTDEEIEDELNRFAERFPQPSAPARAHAANRDSLDAAHTVPVMQANIATQTSAEESDLPPPLVASENDPATIVYAATILLYRFVHERLAGSGPAQRVSSNSDPGAGPSSGLRAAGSSRTSGEGGGRAMQDVSLERVVGEFRDDARDVGFGRQQTVLNVRHVTTELRRLADLFEQEQGHKVDVIVDHATQQRMDLNPQWFATLASEVLSGGVTWGRVVSLFVFAARFMYRLMSQMATDVASLVRSLGGVVFGFARLVRDKIASWLSYSGGWLAFLNPQRLIEIERDVEQVHFSPLPTGSSPLVNRATLAVASVVLGIAGFVYWYRSGR